MFFDLSRFTKEYVNPNPSESPEHIKVLLSGFTFLLGLWLYPLSAVASDFYNGLGQESRSEDLLKSVSKGTVVILGEEHDNAIHHDRQVEVLQGLGFHHPHVVVDLGMEFFEFPKQDLVDQFVLGILPEDEFLQMMGWGELSFDLYRRQVLFPSTREGRTLALNSPRSLTGKVAKTGLESLSEAEQKLIPPNFELGNSLYRERFAAYMGHGHHIPPDAFERYFAAQSLWDDTMAFTAGQHLEKNPEHILVILVGDFHASYGGGLPDRLRARGIQDLVVLTQVNAQGLGPAQIQELVSPHSRYGQRSDYVWLSGR